MTEQLWTISSTITGEVLAPCWITESTGQHPKDAGWPGWNPDVQKATRIERQPRPDLEVWSGTAWVEDPAKVEPILIAQVKAQASNLKAAVGTPGTLKSKIYAAKQAEVNAFYQLGGMTQLLTGILAAVLALPSAERERRFRYALTEQRLRGESTIQPAIERFAAGAMAADREVARLEAIEQAGVSAIRAASGAAGKRAAFAAISWSWS